MKERPILFSGPMVRALLDGRKTQTRRIVKMQPAFHLPGNYTRPMTYSFTDRGHCGVAGFGMSCEGHEFGFCPYGQPGDRLWVRESFRWIGATDDGQYKIEYRADGSTHWLGYDDDDMDNEEAFHDRLWRRLERFTHEEHGKAFVDVARVPWRPSIFMPRWASRITLEIVSVRVERVQDISEYDAREEGIPDFTADGKCINKGAVYAALWDSINGAGSWDRNPFVWVIEFKRVKP